MRKRMIISAVVLTTVFVLAGCNGNNSQEVEEQVEIVEDIEQPEEVVEKPVEEIIEEQEEEVEMPEFILYDENGELYTPQEVTADDIYARIDEIREKYDFENDWERDRVIGILLLYNSCYMSEDDINTIYDDYLANFGGQNIDQQSGFESRDLFEGTNKIDLRDYFIDEKIAEEADRICEYYKYGDIQKYYDKLEEIAIYVGENGYEEQYYYTPLEDYYLDVLIYSDDIEISEISENIDLYSCNGPMPDVLNYDIVNIRIDDYVSSHQE